MSENTRISKTLAEAVRKYISEKYVSSAEIQSFKRSKNDLPEGFDCFVEDNPVDLEISYIDHFDEEPHAFLRKPERSKARGIEGPDIEIKLEETFQEMLFRKIDEKRLSEVETYKAANISKQHFSKIKSDRFYRPKKSTVYAFAVSMHLSLAETKELLERAGFAISHSSVSDIIMEYFIGHGKYNLFEINNTLYEFDQAPLMQTEREKVRKNAQNRDEENKI